MIAKIEPSGCIVRRGKVRLRFNFYLEPTDPRYEEHHVLLPVIPEEGYPGEVDEFGIPVDQNDYDLWKASLPKQWQNNPFHNHFEYMDDTLGNLGIRTLIIQRLQQFSELWVAEQDIGTNWKTKIGFVKLIPGDESTQHVKKCENRIKNLKKNIDDFDVVLGIA